ncbi:ATP-binding cassette domain-containing protein [Litoricolaceae bacterium]|nr:ATP-binding cassette domain-containing protein [Litorivicinaceae bacterium]
MVVEFSGFRAVDEVSLDIEAQGLVCLIGPNGAGKTTMLDCICGKTQNKAGGIFLDGTDISSVPEFRRSRLGIGRKFQTPSVFDGLTVAENIWVSLRKETNPFSNLSNFYLSMDEEWVAGVSEMLGLGLLLDKKAEYLSHGQRQWLEIAMVVAQSPAIILMDEPAAGMTASEKLKTAEIFNSLKKSHSLVVVDHDMGFVRDIADQVIVMHQGKVLAEGTVEEISKDESVKSAYLGSKGLV